MIRWRCRPALVLLVVSGLVAAACGGGKAPASTAPSVASTRPTEPVPTSVPSSSAPPSREPSLTAPPSHGEVADLPESGQTVFPGTYTTHFKPAVTLTIGSEVDLSCVPGYQCRGDVDVNLPSWLFFEFGNAPAFELGIDRIDKVFDPKHPGKAIAPPKDLAAWIEALPGVTMVAPPRHIMVGGLEAIQLDIRSGGKGAAIGPIPGVADPGAGIGPHFQSRIDVVNVHGNNVLIFVDAQQDSIAQFQAATSALQPLIDSIVWH